ncbi:tetratricopeptide repeat protein [Draconibacterium halophilum]|uniref:Tetratricopeptide repeat protein n=1 Tax=Draconibacterium halophilum TaxID=2706887 RepID=A0A6C0RFR6_9BACT|nr:tetratricopeptide repeat protein [Draconibacterium halophilum]QIA08917.1 tetratricopeptide repeat protein [Draconibacterium halophilum]
MLNKSIITKTLFLFAVSVLWLACNTQPPKTINAKISYPADGTVFPPEFPPPTCFWETGNNESFSWRISVLDSEKQILHESEIGGKNRWTPSSETWEAIKKHTNQRSVSLILSAVDEKQKSFPVDTVSIQFSADSVEAPIFYRSVPLPFKFARENLTEVRWQLGNIGSQDAPSTVLSDIPVCGNCHSVSADGSTLAMDVDARDEKGAYAIVELGEETIMSENEIINWSNFVNGEFTYGLLSQISADGRYVVSTLKDSEIFVDRNDLEYSQLFFPFKGILGFYDRVEEKYFELEGANDSNYVHSNPSWGPNGEYIYFTRSRAAHLEESGIFRGSQAVDYKAYNKFLNAFLEREKLFKFDIYRIPFNNGKGGKAEPVPGASNNGMSNYFPRFTPDGKFMIFCKAESFMLLMPDSKLYIQPVNGGETRLMNCNSDNMNSWHSISPNSRWMVFSSKKYGPYTQLLLTHIDENGNDSPPVYLEYFASGKRAANIPEFINMSPDAKIEIVPKFLEDDAFALRMGEIKSKEKKYEEALEYFNNALDLNTNNSDAHHGKAHALMLLKKPNEAILHFNKAVELKPEKVEYLLSRGNASLTLNNEDKAMADFNRAIAIDKMNFMAYNNRGMLWRNKRNPEKALADFNRSIELNPESNVTYVNRGVVNAITKNYEKALADFETSIQLDADDLSAYFAKAKVYQELQESNKALEVYSQAISRAANNPETYFNRALFYMQTNDRPSAMNDLQIAAGMNYKPALEKLNELR